METENTEQEIKQEERAVFSIDITDPHAVRFYATAGVTPEKLADLCVCLGHVYTGKNVTKCLTENGHENAEARFEQTFKELLTKVLAVAMQAYSEPMKEKPLVPALSGLDNVKKISGIFNR